MVKVTYYFFRGPRFDSHHVDGSSQLVPGYLLPSLTSTSTEHSQVYMHKCMQNIQAYKIMKQIFFLKKMALFSLCGYFGGLE